MDSSDKKLTHGVIIRFHYDDDNPRFHWRFAYFESVVLPRLLNQTNQDFDICIRCNPVHKKKFEALSSKIKTFTVNNEHTSYKSVGGRTYFKDFVTWSCVNDLPKYDIQTSLDSDDLVSRDYIEKIVTEVSKSDPNQSLHVYFQPEMFLLETLEIKQFNEYKDDSASAFFSVYQPDKSEGYFFVNMCSHLVIGKHASKSVRIPEGYCYASVHYHNESTSIKDIKTK